LLSRQLQVAYTTRDSLLNCISNLPLTSVALSHLPLQHVSTVLQAQGFLFPQRLWTWNESAPGPCHPARTKAVVSRSLGHSRSRPVRYLKRQEPIQQVHRMPVAPREARSAARGAVQGNGGYGGETRIAMQGRRCVERWRTPASRCLGAIVGACTCKAVETMGWCAEFTEYGSGVKGWTVTADVVWCVV
jgi:hypothetical protein